MSDSSVRGWIDGRQDDIIHFLCEIIAIDSVTGREGPMAGYCASWLEERGIEAILQPAKDRHNAIGVVGTGSRALILSGHLDTVPPNPGRWTYGPFTPTVADGKVFGLGASDLHASIAATYFAQLYLKEKGYELPGRLISAFTIEEETTGDGTQLFLDWSEKEGFLDFEKTWCVVTEPTGLDHLCLGNRASSFVVLEIAGKGGHGSRPHLAKSPLTKLMQILAGLSELEARWGEEYADAEFGAPTLTPTSVNCGDRDSTNVIPETARAVVDCRPTPELWSKDLALFRRELGACIDGFREEGFEIAWSELYPREGHKLQRGHPLAELAISALRDDLGVADAEVRYTPAGNDAVFFGIKGIPTINKVGPGHPECAHRVDEYVTIENLLRGTELYVRLALRFFGLSPR